MTSSTSSAATIITKASSYSEKSRQCWNWIFIYNFRISTLVRLNFKLASWFWTSLSSPSTVPPTPSPPLRKVVVPSKAERKIEINRRMSIIHQATQTPLPQLSPSLCFNTGYLRDFLRTSRSQLDDTISTNLNGLLTPSVTSPFNPLSTLDPSTNRKGKQAVPLETCQEFTSEVVFPIWSTRSKVLSYCSIVASSPDPDDPDKTAIEAENMAQSHRIVNERLDPYSGRFFPREPRAEMLGSLLRNESAVENIVRDRTWRTLNERCIELDSTQKGWHEAFKSWEEQQKK